MSGASFLCCLVLKLLLVGDLVIEEDGDEGVEDVGDPHCDHRGGVAGDGEG